MDLRVEAFIKYLYISVLKEGRMAGCIKTADDAYFITVYGKEEDAFLMRSFHLSSEGVEIML